jgi:hypothetical protein
VSADDDGWDNDLSTKQISPEEGEFKWPKYSDKADIVVEILGPCEVKVYKWEIGDYACGAGCTFYIQEGMGLEYFVDTYGEEITGPGYWTFVGVHGVYYRGDGWTTDDDEDWYFDELRPSTPEEISEAS